MSSHSISRVYHAFMDESGDRGASPNASDFFVLSAVLIEDKDLTAAGAFLAELRSDLRRSHGDELSWKFLKSHADRLHAARSVGGFVPITMSTVVSCKRSFDSPLAADLLYMYTFRYLLERVSWFARDRNAVANLTLAHVKGFKLPTLRSYEQKLRAMQTQVDWRSLPAPTTIDQPSRVENLQLADLAASASAQAFEPDAHGNTEPRYLRELAPRLYRRPPGALTSYGLKIHPWDPSTKATLAWVQRL